MSGFELGRSVGYVLPVSSTSSTLTSKPFIWDRGCNQQLYPWQQHTSVRRWTKKQQCGKRDISQILPGTNVCLEQQDPGTLWERCLQQGNHVLCWAQSSIVTWFVDNWHSCYPQYRAGAPVCEPAWGLIKDPWHIGVSLSQSGTPGATDGCLTWGRRKSGPQNSDLDMLTRTRTRAGNASACI